MATRKQLTAALEAADKDHEAAEAVMAVVLAVHGLDSPEEEKAQKLCNEKLAIRDAAARELGKAFPAPLGRIGDRGCGKSRR